MCLWQCWVVSPSCLLCSATFPHSKQSVQRTACLPSWQILDSGTQAYDKPLRNVIKLEQVFWPYKRSRFRSNAGYYCLPGTYRSLPGVYITLSTVCQGVYITLYTPPATVSPDIGQLVHGRMLMSFMSCNVIKSDTMLITSQHILCNTKIASRCC